jgi:iron complex outermembrane receptor protein
VFQDVSIAPAGSLFDQSALASEKYGAKLTYVREDTLWNGLQIAAGADYLHDETFQELAQTDRLWVPLLKFQEFAPFVQLEQTFLNEAVRLSGGLRYENVALDVPDFTTIASAGSTFVQGSSLTFDKLLGNAGIVVEPLEGLTFFSSYAQGFTMPDAGLVLRSVNTPGQTVADLIDLQPVIADNIEIGAGYHKDGLNLDASYFWSNSDLGSRIQVVNGAGQIRRERTEISGFEFAADYHFPSGFGFGANFAKLYGRFDSDGDDIVDRDLDGRNISPDRLNLFVEGPIAAGLSARLQSSTFFDRTFDGGLPQNDFDGFTLVDLALSYTGNDFGDFSLGIQNILDKQYITYYAQTVTFVNDSTYVSGRGRAFTLGWKYSF